MPLEASCGETESMKLVSASGITWVDLEDPSRGEIEALGAEHGFHHLNVDDCLSKRNLPKVDDHGGHVYILLQFPVFDEKKGRLRASQVSMFLGKDYVVTIHEAGFGGTKSLFKQCEADANLRSQVMRSTTDVFYRVMDALVDEMFPLLLKVREDLEDIEDRVYDPRESVALELMRQRRVIADFRHVIAPLRRLYLDMTIDAQRFSDHNLGKYFADIRDHIEKAWGVLEEAKETIEIYKDTDYVLSSELTSKVLAVLTIIFTLTIPASVVGGLYGMNIPLPGGLQPGPPTFLGPFTTFIILMTISVVPAVVMAVYFRRKGWM